ncbi:MAG: SLBB domain-containing protein [Ignavibacteria bacterium]
MKLTFLTIIVLLNFNSVFSQDDDLIIGQNSTKTSAALYDLSDPTGVNIEVNLWGTVKLPGRYRVPINTTFLDLLSYAGGPIENSKLDDIRIFRPSKDTLTVRNQVIKLNYNDLLWGERVRTEKKLNPTLKSGDIVILLEEKRLTFRDQVGFYLPILTSIISIVTLIVTLTRK